MGLAHSRKNDDQPWFDALFPRYGYGIALTGDRKRGISLLEESLVRSSNDKIAPLLAFRFLGDISLIEGDYAAAARHYLNAFTVNHDDNLPWHTAASLEGLAHVASARRNNPLAARLIGAAELRHDAIGQPMEPMWVAPYQKMRASVKSSLGEETFARELTAGKRLRLDSIEEEFLGQEPVSDGAIADLTPRQQEVLRLMAKGLSNQEIAEALYISPLTVRTHVVNLFAKLDLHTRAAVTAYALKHGLI
jgi:DNA-binding CsgD family transcriptional regulator